MIVQKNFLTKLRDFGLNTYESKLWTALLSRGFSTAGELSDIANVPRSRTYDVLESLEKKGFILRKTGKPIKYMAVPPEEVIERVKQKINEETEQHIRSINDITKSELLDELNSLHTKGAEFIEPSELMGAIKSKDNILNHLESRMSRAKNSISILTTPDGISTISKNFVSLFKALNSKGVKVRIATQIKKEMKESILELSKYAELRHTDLKGRLFTIDGSEVVFMVLDDKVVHPSYDTAVWVNTDFFAKAIEGSFDSKWKTMLPADSFLKQ